MIWMKRIAWGVLALLLVIVMTVAALLYTPAGVKVAVWGAQKALPALSVGDTSGSLLRGFTLEAVQYDEPPMALSVDRLRLDIDDSCLLMPAVCITELGISGVQFSMPELPPPGAEAPEPPAEPVTEIAMPLPIRVERVVLDDIALDVLGNQVTWQHFATAAEMEGSRLVLKPTDWEGINLTLAPAIPADSSQASSSAPSTAAPPAAEPIVLPEVVLPLAVEVQRFTVKDFTLQGETPQQVRFLELAATAEGSEITIRKLLVDVPQAKLDATAAVTLAADYPLQLDADLEIAMAPLQDHQLQLQAGGSLGALSLDASLKGTIDALVKGSLSPLDPALPFEFEVTSQHIQWPIDQDAQFEVADTVVKAAGDLNGFTFTVATAVDGAPMPAVKAALAGQGDLTQVTLEKLVVDTLGGTITGNAKASWKDQVRWQGALDFSHIQPGLEWPEAKGDLSGKLRTSGGLTEQGGWFVELPELAVDGLLMEQRLTLDGQLNASDKSGQGNIELLTERLRLQHGPNGLTAQGRLSETWDMIAQVNAPDLSRSLPDAKGRIQGDIVLSGKMAEPDIDLQLEANGLAWQELATLEQLSLKGRVTPMPVLKADIRLNASKGVAEGAKLKTLSLAFQGTEAKHQLVLDLDAEPVSAALQLSGQLNREVGWQGVLQQGEIGTEIGPWRLNRPTKLGFDFKNQLVRVAPHCWQQDKSALCLSEAMEAGASGHAKLAVNNFDFTLIAPFMPETVELKGALGANVEAIWAPEAAPYVKAQVLLPSGSVVKQDDPEAEPLKVGWDRVTLNAELKRNVLRSEWAIAIRDNGDISGRARITELTGEQQLDARVKIDRFTLGFLTPLIKGYEQFDGQVDADLLVSGPVMHPAINGLLNLSRVKAVGRQVPLDIDQADITVSFSGYSGTLRGELLTPDGRLRLQGNGNWQDLAAWRSQLQINGRELKVNVPPMLALKVSPDLTINASPNEAEISGVVAIPWGRITVDQLPESAVAVSDDEILLTDDLQPIETEPAIPFTVKTNVRVKIGNNVKLSAFGLKTGLVGELNVRQQDRGPMVYGEVNLRKGTYRSFGQELLIRKGQILFTGPADQPYLAIEAIRNPNSIEDDVTAGIRVSGPADKPRADIFSDPAMPQQNALSYLLRGRDIDAESGDSGSAMTTALISMGLAKSGQLVGGVGEAFGVQDLALDTAGSGDSSQVTISGYIAPGLQVKYGVGIFNAIGEFTVRYRLMKDLYVEGVSGLDSAVDLLYQFEFN